VLEATEGARQTNSQLARAIGEVMVRRFEQKGSRVCAIGSSVAPTHESLTEGGSMTNHVRMGIYAITKGTYDELIEQARGGLAPILRDSPGFVFYATTDVGGGRFVSVSTWQTREQAEAAAAKSAEWVSENMADSVALEENLIGEMTTLAATERSAV
jgi:heme-degrading monooxygenase HmoA